MYIFEERAIGSEVIMLNASLTVAKFWSIVETLHLVVSVELSLINALC